MIALKIVGFVALGIAAFLVATYLVMRLWNWLVPSLFNGPRLRFAQALGLIFLTRLLVGFGGPARHWGDYGHRDGKAGRSIHCEPADSVKNVNVHTTTYKR